MARFPVDAELALEDGASRARIDEPAAAYRLRLARVPDVDFVHVAVVYEASEARFYVDGKLVGKHDLAKAKLTNDWEFEIGRAQRGDGQFVGLMDELRISNTARYSTDFQPERQCKIVQRIHLREQVKVLEDEAGASAELHL